MTYYIDDAAVSEAPMTAQERRDIKEEHAAEQYAESYEQVKAEREAAGLSNSPIIVCAEAARRLREKARKK